jgi:hypothetical protein
MKAVRLTAALLGFAALLLAPALGADPKVKQKDAQAAFDQMTDLYKTVMKPLKSEKREVGTGTATVIVADWPPDTFAFDPVKVPGIPDPSTLGVKIWASLATKDGKETGQYVCIPKYKWHANEYFYVYITSATPLQVGFYQDYPENGMITKTRQVLPSPEFPESYQTVLPGQPYKFPTLIKMDDSLEPEFMAIVCAIPGSSPDLEINKLHPRTGSGNDGAVRLAKAQQEGMDAVRGKALKSPKGRLTGVVPSIDPSNIPLGSMPDPNSQVTDLKTTSTNTEDVSVIQFGSQNFGYTLFKLYK